MKFIIEITGATQPELMEGLDHASRLIESGDARATSVKGVVVGYERYQVAVRPADSESGQELARQFAAAHPRPAAQWVKMRGTS